MNSPGHAEPAEPRHRPDLQRARAGGPPAGRSPGSPAGRCRTPGRAGDWASTLANYPPRLWPTMAARRPWRSTRLSSRSSRRSIVAPEHPTLARMPGPAWMVARVPQPAGHEAQRLVAREEARHQQHRLPTPVAHARAPEHRVAQEAGQLQRGPRLAPEGGMGSGLRQGPCPLSGLMAGRYPRIWGRGTLAVPQDYISHPSASSHYSPEGALDRGAPGSGARTGADPGVGQGGRAERGRHAPAQGRLPRSARVSG